MGGPAEHAGEGPLASIVVPTFREAGNLRELIERVFAAVNAAGLATEIIIVDDNSQDGTEQIVAELAERHPVRLVIRTEARGLSSAVVEGFDRARGRYLLCMDADLSHPPEKVPDLLRRIASGECDFVLGSRYVGGGGVSADWPLLRRLNSRLATLLALPLAPVGDPMSGFFCLSSDTYRSARGRIRPLGYKIGLELMVRCQCRRIVEEPIRFDERHAGKSKLTFRQQAEYVLQVVQLYFCRYPTASRLALLALIGIVVVIVWALMLR